MQLEKMVEGHCSKIERELAAKLLHTLLKDPRFLLWLNASYDVKILVKPRRMIPKVKDGTLIFQAPFSKELVIKPRDLNKCKLFQYYLEDLLFSMQNR